MKKLKIFVLFILMNLHCPFILFSQTEMTIQYKKGIEALEKNNISKAEGYFKESIGSNRDAASFYQLGKIQVKMNTHNSKNEALENLKQAALREPMNYEYRMAFAEILENFAKSSAYNEFDSLIKTFPDKTGPLLAMGKLKLQYYIEFKNSKSIGQVKDFFPGDEHLVDSDMSDVVKADSLEAVTCFFKVLAIDPLNAEAYLSLGRLYEHATEFGKAIEYSNKALKADPNNKETHLLLGILFNQTGELKKANNEFKKAIELMDETEKEDFMYNSVLKVLSPKYTFDGKNMTKKEIEDFIARYWNMYNPQEKAEYNQTLLEHYSRVAYANLRFSIPKYGITGWKTERGEVILRYGQPRYVVKYRPGFNYYTGEFFAKSDIWAYRGLLFSFDDDLATGNSRLSTKGAYLNPRSFIGSFEVFQKVKSRMNSSYVPKGNRFAVPTRLYAFKNRDNNVNPDEHYLIYPLPLQIKNRKINLNNASWDYGLFFYDNNLNPVFEKTGLMSTDNVVKLTREKKNKEMISNIKFSSPINAQTMKFQITRHSDSSYYTYAFPYYAKQWKTNELDISDVVLASEINDGSEIAGAIKRKDIYIVPSANSTFIQGEPVFIYYELYSLELGKDKSADFEQTITIEKSEGVQTRSETILEALWNGVKQVLKGSNERVSLTSSYKSIEKDSQQYLQLDFGGYPPGVYNITLSVEDKVNSSKVEKKFLIAIAAGGKK